MSASARRPTARITSATITSIRVNPSCLARSDRPKGEPRLSRPAEELDRRGFPRIGREVQVRRIEGSDRSCVPSVRIARGVEHEVELAGGYRSAYPGKRIDDGHERGSRGWGERGQGGSPRW